MSIDSIETTLTKNYKEENFPVGSWLLSKKIRYQMLVFYNFARAADDIADSPILNSYLDLIHICDYL